MGTKIPKIGKNGDKNPQNRLKWGQKSPKSSKMGTIVTTVATIAMAPWHSCVRMYISKMGSQKECHLYPISHFSINLRYPSI